MIRSKQTESEEIGGGAEIQKARASKTRTYLAENKHKDGPTNTNAHAEGLPVTHGALDHPPHELDAVHARKRVLQVWRGGVHVGKARVGAVLPVDILVRPKIGE